jgi:diketogulonate reductase-like aldo/keto reductase
MGVSSGATEHDPATDGGRNMGGSEKALAGGSYALKCGIHHIDTAQIYGTEKEAGEAIQNAGLKREEVYITTKRESAHLVRMSRLQPSV